MTAEGLTVIAKGFQERWQFPNCCGAIDGKRVACTEKYKLKGFHSIVLFAVADANYKFTFLDIESFGSEGEANIFAASVLERNIAANNINFPEDADVGTTKLPYFFIGDDAFPLSKRFIKPYPVKKNHQPLHEDEQIFNYRLSRLRRCVENAFSILCSRWLVLKKTMLCNPDRAQKILYACCLLHNCLIGKKTDNANADAATAGSICGLEWSTENLSEDSMFHSCWSGSSGWQECEEGRAVRNELKRYFSAEGSEDPSQRESASLN